MKRWALLVAASLFLAGCSSHRHTGTLSEPSATSTKAVIHVVQAGQTLWRIARAYGVSEDAIAEANSLGDHTQIRVGQGLRIPGATQVLDVPPAPGLAGDASKPGEVAPSPPQPPDERVSPQGWSWPVPGQIISRFGARRSHGPHQGVDIRARTGTPVRAARDGRVSFAGVQQGYGKIVILAHKGAYASYYAHNSRLKVRQGDWVKGGDVIALSGATGNAQGPHLHFEIRHRGRPVDPLLLLP